jgi:hypothetical protein
MLCTGPARIVADRGAPKLCVCILGSREVDDGTNRSPGLMLKSSKRVGLLGGTPVSADGCTSIASLRLKSSVFIERFFSASCRRAMARFLSRCQNCQLRFFDVFLKLTSEIKSFEAWIPLTRQSQHWANWMANWLISKCKALGGDGGSFRKGTKSGKRLERATSTLMAACVLSGDPCSCFG